MERRRVYAIRIMRRLDTTDHTPWPTAMYLARYESGEHALHYLDTIQFARVFSVREDAEREAEKLARKYEVLIVEVEVDAAGKVWLLSPEFDNGNGDDDGKAA